MRILFLSFLVITVISCKKAVKTAPEFVGNWYGVTNACNLSITIPATGKARYYKLCDTIYVESEGVAYLKSKKEILKIGKREFNIYGGDASNFVPYLVSDTLRITLDGVYFTKMN